MPWKVPVELLNAPNTTRFFMSLPDFKGFLLSSTILGYPAHILTLLRPRL